jgi:hypothetical protein
MANTRNDELDRNRNTPLADTNTPNTQGSTSPGSMGSASPGSLGQTGRDAVSRDRDLNRDTELDRESSGSALDRDRGRGPDDISE